MEQILSAFGIDWRLISIQIFNFTILAVVLWYFLYTPVLNLLKERQEKIERGVKDAEAAAESRTAADEEKRAVLEDAQKEAERIAARAKTHAEEKAAEILTTAETRAAHIAEKATERGVEIQDRARKESEAEIAKLAVLTAERILREKNS